MKNLCIFIGTLVFFVAIGYSQNVAINGTGVVGDASAGLDISFTNRGLLIPRLALTQTTNPAPVTSPATSLLVYNTATINDVTPGYYYWGGTQWIRFNTGSGNGWLTTGNSGTNPSTNFIGTIDNVDWVIRTNNTERIRVGANGNVGIKTGVNNFVGVDNYYAPTALDNAIGSINSSSRNNLNIWTPSLTNNAVSAGSVNTIDLFNNFQNQFSQTSGIAAASYNYANVLNNGGTNVGIYGKTCGTYNYSFVTTNNALGQNVGTYNYSITATTQPVNAATLGIYNYSIVNSPNNGDIYGIFNYGISNSPNNGTIYGISNWSQSNGSNNVGGTLYGGYTNTQSNGPNNGTIYGLYNITGSNGPNNAGAVRYGIYNTWTENVSGSSGNTYGIYNNNGAYFVGSTNTVYGIYSTAAGGAVNYAGYFLGDVTVNGNFTATGTKMFTIDHPFDPENKYLKHFCVESNEVLNHYSGTVITDENGLATVKLPDYFEAINIDFRYQLTPIGQFSQVIIKEEVKNNQFVIQSEFPNVKISWQIEAQRNDLNMIHNPVTDVVIKPANEKGKYLQPELYNQSPDKGIHFVDDEGIKKENAAKGIRTLDIKQ